MKQPCVAGGEIVLGEDAHDLLADEPAGSVPDSPAHCLGLSGVGQPQLEEHHTTTFTALLAEGALAAATVAVGDEAAEGAVLVAGGSSDWPVMPSPLPTSGSPSRRAMSAPKAPSQA